MLRLFMRVEEELQESRIDESSAWVAEDKADLRLPVPPFANWLKLAYCFEYLIAMQAAITVWAEIGGQGHMDLVAWYLKLPCITALAWCVVRFTAAMVEQPQTWTRRTRIWFAGVLLLCGLMGLITFYYHLHEVTDEVGSEESASASVRDWRHAERADTT